MLACYDFKIGSDGQQCWFYIRSKDSQRLTIGSVAEIHQKNVAVGDPFDLLTAPIDRTLKRLQPRYLGCRDLGSQKCHVLEAWSVQSPGTNFASGELTEWWIDAASLRPVEVRLFYPHGLEARYLFHQEQVNQPIPDTAFAPPTVAGLKPEPVEPPDTNYTTRFLNAMDGSTGRMSVRWGKFGPKGRSSSGLN